MLFSISETPLSTAHEAHCNASCTDQGHKGIKIAE